MIVDGAKALDTAVTQTFGRAALVQRCQVPKGRNILEHLPEAQRPWVKGGSSRAPTRTATSRRPSVCCRTWRGAWTLTTRVRPRACGKGSTRR